MFSQLMMGFMLIVFVMLIFNYISINTYNRYLNALLTKNVGERFEHYTSQIEQTFDKIVLNILYDFYCEYMVNIKNNDFNPYDLKNLTAKSAQYKTISECFDNIFFLSNNSDEIVTLKSIYSKNDFFSRYYKSDTYNDEFWQKEINQEFQYRFYPAEYFTEYGLGGLNNDRIKYLIPIAWKENSNNDFILVALIDANKLFKPIESNFLMDFYIYNNYYEEWYAFNCENLQSFKSGPFKTADLEIKDLNFKEGYLKIETGFIFFKQSTYINLTYYKFVTSVEIKDKIREIKMISKIFIFISIIVSGFISLFLVIQFNNPVKRLIETIKSRNEGQYNEDIVNLRYLNSSVRNIIDSNIKMQNELSKKDSILKSMHYTAQILNIFSGDKNRIGSLVKDDCNF